MLSIGLRIPVDDFIYDVMNIFLYEEGDHSELEPYIALWKGLENKTFSDLVCDMMNIESEYRSATQNDVDDVNWSVYEYEKTVLETRLYEIDRRGQLFSIISIEQFSDFAYAVMNSIEYWADENLTGYEVHELIKRGDRIEVILT